MTKYFTYKGKPLVRNKETLYYGSMSDEFVVMMKILESKKVNDVEVATKVMVYEMSTDKQLNPLQAIKRKSEKAGLYEALDLASAWLARS
jgi:hypothetical protein